MVFMDPLKRVQALPQGIQTGVPYHQCCNLYITQYSLEESSYDSGTRRTLLPYLHVSSLTVAQPRVNRGAGGCAEEQTHSGSTTGCTSGAAYMYLFSKRPLRIRHFEGQSIGLPTQWEFFKWGAMPKVRRRWTSLLSRGCRVMQTMETS